jgi:transcriptional regulator with XRE-family HTH domain
MQIPEIIADLQRSGLTQVQIAERAGLAQSTVSQLASGARGKRVSVQTSDALMAVWRAVCARRADPHEVA